MKDNLEKITYSIAEKKEIFRKTNKMKEGNEQS